MFDCDRCGLCCRHLKGIKLLRDLDDGGGICRFLDRGTNLCTIYGSRPLFCNVDAAYDAFFRDEMTREEFYRLNHLACKKLKEES